MTTLLQIERPTKMSDEVKDCPKCGSHMTLLDNGEWWCVDGTAFGKCDGPDSNENKQTSDFKGEYK